MCYKVIVAAELFFHSRHVKNIRNRRKMCESQAPFHLSQTRTICLINRQKVLSRITIASPLFAIKLHQRSRRTFIEKPSRSTDTHICTQRAPVPHFLSHLFLLALTVFLSHSRARGSHVEFEKSTGARDRERAAASEKKRARARVSSGPRARIVLLCKRETAWDKTDIFIRESTVAAAVAATLQSLPYAHVCACVYTPSPGGGTLILHHHDARKLSRRRRAPRRAVAGAFSHFLYRGIICDASCQLECSSFICLS